MLPGFGGHLISESFLEQWIETAAPRDSTTVAVRTDLRASRLTTRCHGPASSVRAVLDAVLLPFVRALGFVCSGPFTLIKDGIAGTLLTGEDPVALIVGAWGAPLDAFWRSAIAHAAAADTPWCLLFNGTHARLIEARRLYARRHVEFDIDIALDDERASAGLVTLLHAQAFRTSAGHHTSALHALIDRSERHSAGVCQALRAGVFEAATEVLKAILETSRRHEPDTFFEQALTIVYRILFLLFAEARSLVPVWHPIYRESYSVESLCDLAGGGQRSAGLWDALRAINRLAHAGCRAGDLNVTAFNGRLFSPNRTPLAERSDLDDGAAGRALRALSTRVSSDRQSRERISYRDLGVEELGAVYESLIDYRPRINRGNRTGANARGMRLTLENGTGLRKATGTFYTPRPIVQYVLRHTLDPLLRDASPDRILELKILDPSMGSGAFLVAACAHLARAYEAALVRSGGFHPTDFGPAERARIRRTIAERCLFGVDVNPMAVQLARLSLWLATLASDRPLSFLDHHLATGDSLIGAWLSSLKRPPPTIRRRASRAQEPALPLFREEALADTLRAALPARFSLAVVPNDTTTQVRDKERMLADLNRRDSDLSKWKRVADVWCARWFADPSGVSPPASAFGALSDAILNGRGALPDEVASRFLRAAETVAGGRKFFHWELEFPEVFFDEHGVRRASGGFDAVVGNPPWDMIRGDAGSQDARADARDAGSEELRFTRDSAVYTSQSSGHANRYQLFLERAVALTRPGGRLGLVLPSGLATDHGNAPLRRLLFSQCAVDGFAGFDNSGRIFPIHRSVRFLLLTATAGIPTTEFGCRLGERDPAVLEASGDEAASLRSWFRLRVTPAFLERVSGDGLDVPDLRHPIDLAILERAASLFLPLGDARGWAAAFGRELNATDDRDDIRPGGRGWPVVEGKMIEPFRIDLAALRGRITETRARQLIGGRGDRARLAYRDVASATNRMTLIAAVLPARTASVHTVFCLRTPLQERAQYFLCGLFNSFVVNFLVRLRVTTHVTTSIVERLPVPDEGHRPDAVADIAAMARRLAAGPDAVLFARLNARVAALYQLSREEFAHVLETFPLVDRRERDDAMAAFRYTPRNT